MKTLSPYIPVTKIVEWSQRYEKELRRRYGREMPDPLKPKPITEITKEALEDALKESSDYHQRMRPIQSMEQRRAIREFNSLC